MATDSKSAFDNNVVRARYFLKIHEKHQKGAGSPPLMYRELPRAAIVFAVGAVDSYLSEVSAEVMVRQLQAAVATAGLRDTLKRIQADIPTLPLEISVLPTNAERLRRLKDSIADHFHNKTSNHGSKAVGATMTRLGGKVADVWSTLIGNGHQKPIDTLDKWTQIRHDIVHKGKKPKVRRPQAEDFISFVDDLVARIDTFAETA